jgi:hypothetical protein
VELKHVFDLGGDRQTNGMLGPVADNVAAEEGVSRTAVSQAVDIFLDGKAVVDVVTDVAVEAPSMSIGDKLTHIVINVDEHIEAAIFAVGVPALEVPGGRIGSTSSDLGYIAECVLLGHGTNVPVVHTTEHTWGIEFAVYIACDLPYLAIAGSITRSVDAFGRITVQGLRSNALEECFVNICDDKHFIELGSTGAEGMHGIHLGDVLECFTDVRLGNLVTVDDASTLVALEGTVGKVFAGKEGKEARRADVGWLDTPSPGSVKVTKLFFAGRAPALPIRTSASFSDGFWEARGLGSTKGSRVGVRLGRVVFIDE